MNREQPVGRHRAAEVGFRVQVTAANSDAQVDALLDTLSWLMAGYDPGGPVLRTG